MSVWFQSIRAKVWLCVTIVLMGYFAATLVGFYVNIYQYKRLTHLQSTHIPLTALGNEVVKQFEKQTEEYEDAFLLAEAELSEQAAAMNSNVLSPLDQLILLIREHPSSPVQSTKLQQIRKDYLQLTAMAEQLHPRIANATFSTISQKKIQQFSEAQRNFSDKLHALAATLNNALLLEVEQHKNRALNSIILLSVLFMVVFFVVAVSVGQVSSALLVAPLKNIQENVERFEQGVRLKKPTIENNADEISQLATAFWNMTEKLSKTMVSKNYVDNIINNISGALVVLNPDLTIHRVNPQTLDLFGFNEEELSGKPLSLLVDCNQDNLNSSKRIKRLFRGEAVRNAEVCATNKSGQEIPLHFSGAPMYDDLGNLNALICLFDDVTELKQAEAKLKQLAHHDPLTGLANRNLFFDCLQHALHDAKRHGRIFALLYLDLDKFKPINDTLGHEFGDLALQEVSRRLQKTLRGDDTIARVGGDEFIVILNGLPDVSAAAPLAEKVIDTILTPVQIGSLSHQLGVSVGISVFPGDGKDADTLISKADKAMYVAKHSGGNGYSGGGHAYNRTDGPAATARCKTLRFLSPAPGRASDCSGSTQGCADKTAE